MLQTANEHEPWRHLVIAVAKLWVTCITGVEITRMTDDSFLHLLSFFRLFRQQSGMDVESIRTRAESGE